MGATRVPSEELNQVLDEVLAASAGGRYGTANGGVRLAAWLVERSDLPGPRANLELLHAFADAVARRAGALQAGPLRAAALRGGASAATGAGEGGGDEGERTGVHGADGAADAPWALSLALAAARAPEDGASGKGGDPSEFVACCGVVALAAIACVRPERWEDAMHAMERAAVDERWRVREAAAMGLQRLLPAHEAATLEALDRWLDGPELNGMLQGAPYRARAVVAAVAEPALLKVDALAAAAVRLHQKAVAAFLGMDDRRSDPVRTLRQALGYSISVVATARPEPMFALLEALARGDDPDGRWIVRENVKKRRIAAAFPERVAVLRAAVDPGT